MTVDQFTGYGDYDGDSDVSATDRAAAEVGGACRGSSPSGACRILDLDFDDDVEDDDLTLFDLLSSGLLAYSGRTSTNVDQPFGHQGLLFESEIFSYQNRMRNYLPDKRRFLQRDPLSEGPYGLIQHKLVHGGTSVLAEIAMRASDLYNFVPDRLNVYNYVSNSPVVMLDPSGGCSNIMLYTKPILTPPPSFNFGSPTGMQFYFDPFYNPYVHRWY